MEYVCMFVRPKLTFVSFFLNFFAPSLIGITTYMFMFRCIMDNQAMFTAQQMQYKQMYAGIDPTGR